MKKLATILFFTGTLHLMAVAQSNEEQAIADVINRVFTGMHRHDSTLVRSAFANEVTLVSVVRNREGTPVLRRESVHDFVKAIAQPQPESLTEEIWNMKIQIDGDFAQAWCDYAFYVGNRFNHCGADAFHLYKTAGGWKIFHLADTRRKEGCIVPEEIQKKHK
jgi:hypothetical protein